jgi:hypothetical protein
MLARTLSSASHRSLTGNTKWPASLRARRHNAREAESFPGAASLHHWNLSLAVTFDTVTAISEWRRIVARVIVLSLKSFYGRRCRSRHAPSQNGSASAHALPFKGDRRRRIDRYIDYFGSARPVLAALAVAGCAGLSQPSNQDGVITRVLPPSLTSAEPIRSAEKQAPAFTDGAQDRFFSLLWRATDSGDQVHVNGLLENLNGPEVIDVTLRITLWTAQETPLTERLVTFPDILEQRTVRPFAVTVPTAERPSRVSVSVSAYRFPQLGGSK